MEHVATLLTGVLGGTASTLAIATLLGKWFIQHQLDKSLKSHEAQLTEKTEVLKTQLSIYAHEQNIALARVDAQGAQAIHAIYAAIRAWETPVTTIVAGSPLRNVDKGAHINLYLKLCEEAHAASCQLSQTLADHAIYVDVDLYETLGKLTNDCGLAVANVLAPLRQGPAEGWQVAQIYAETEKQRALFAKTYHEHLQPSIQAIAEQFRTTLGILRARAL